MKNEKSRKNKKPSRKRKDNNNISINSYSNNSDSIGNDGYTRGTNKNHTP